MYNDLVGDYVNKNKYNHKIYFLSFSKAYWPALVYLECVDEKKYDINKTRLVVFDQHAQYSQ